MPTLPDANESATTPLDVAESVVVVGPQWGQIEEELSHHSAAVRARGLLSAGLAGRGGKLIDIAAVAGSRVVRQGVLLVAMAVAARILGQELLGVWALIHVVIQFGVLLSDAGISTFVVRERDLSDRLYASAFYGCIALSLIVTALTAAITAPLATLLGYAEYSMYFFAASIAIIPMGINAVLQAKLRRDRKFVAVLITDVVANLTLLIGVVGMLLHGDGLWSLIVPVIVSSSISCIGCSLVTGIARFHIDRESVKRVADYSLGLVGFSAINFWARNADHVLIGRFLGAVHLGIYSIAYRVMTLPLSQVNAIAHTVALPYLAPHQDDKPRLRQAFRQLLAVIGALTVGPMIFIWLQRYFLVDLVFGAGWQRVADLLLVLVPIGVFGTFVNPIGLCFQVSGKTRLFFVIGMIQTAATLASFVVGVWYGSIDAVVIAYSVATLLISPIGIACGLRTIGSGLGDWIAWCGPYLACLPICWCVDYAVELIPTTLNAVVLDALLVLAVCGSVSYVTLRTAWNKR